MKSFKIWILFILLSVVSFSDNNAVSVWVESIGFDSNTNTLKMTLKSRTGEKFEEMDRLKLDGLKITNGLNDVSYLDVSAERKDEIVEDPKIITTWYAEIELGFILVNEPVTLNGKVLIEDFVDGNQHAIDGKILSFGPFTIAPNDKTELRIYEKLSDDKDNWTNDTTGITGSAITVDDYIFTKGGPGSFEDVPGIYALISTDGGAKIEKIMIKKNNDPVITLPVPYPEDSEAVIMKIDGFGSNEINTVTIRPVSIYEIAGDEVTLNFVVDTRVNDSHLEGGIIGELDPDGKIVIDLASLVELSGVNGYSYTFTVGEEKKSGDKDGINVDSFTTLEENSTHEIVTIDPSGLIAGSKGTLLFTVYDQLGNKKEFEKTYFLPAKASGITSRIEGEVKQRNSKIKIVTEGNEDKFGIDSNIEGSSE